MPHPFFIKTKRFKMNVPLICEYICIANPDGAVDMCEKYGYSVDANDKDHVTSTLIDIVDNNADDSTLKNLVAIHPDKNLIIDASSLSSKRMNACGSCANYTPCREDRMIQRYNRVPLFNAIGDEGQKNNSKIHDVISNQTNTLLLIGVLAVGVAILIKQNKN